MKKKKYSYISKEEEKFICEMFIKLQNSAPISLYFNRTRNVIWKILKKNNLSPKTRSEINTKYSRNENYFNTIDTKDKAYFLGLLVADGSVTHRCLSILLQESDTLILKIFQKYIQDNSNLYFKESKNIKHSNTNTLSIYSYNIVNSLAKWGIIPNKCHKTYFPDIPEKFWSHFIRGIFDGDGHIGNTKNNNRFSITGNFELMKRIQEILMEKCNLNKSAISFKDNKKKTSVHFRYNTAIDLLKIKEFLYQDCEDLYILRKKEKFDSLKFKIFLKECKICGDKVKGYGLCNKHYQQFKKGLAEFDKNKIKWVKVM